MHGGLLQGNYITETTIPQRLEIYRNSGTEGVKGQGYIERQEQGQRMGTKTNRDKI